MARGRQRRVDNAMISRAREERLGRFGDFSWISKKGFWVKLLTRKTIKKI